MRRIILATCWLLLPGCDLAHAPGSSNSGPQQPTARDVAAGYKDLTLLTREPVLVDPGLTLLCVGPTAEQARAARNSSGPHAMTEINVYMNKLAATAFDQPTKRYPVGSAVVKEKWDGAIGGMIKRPAGYDPAHGDWEYFFKDAARIEAGRIASCVRCHSGAAATDYVFGHWANGVSAISGRPAGRHEHPPEG